MSTEHGHTVRKSTYYRVFVVLLVCTYLTWQVAYFDLGALNTVAALGIAAVKGAIVVLFFMHARTSSRLTWVVAVAGLFWLLILMALTGSDYLTRGWHL